MYKTRWEGTVHRDHGGVCAERGGEETLVPPHTSSQQCTTLFHQGRQTASSSTFTAAGVVDIAVTS